jgi:hypothetical protein
VRSTPMSRSRRSGRSSLWRSGSNFGSRVFDLAPKGANYCVPWCVRVRVMWCDCDRWCSL